MTAIAQWCSENIGWISALSVFSFMCMPMWLSSIFMYLCLCMCFCMPLSGCLLPVGLSALVESHPVTGTV